MPGSCRQSAACGVSEQPCSIGFYGRGPVWARHAPLTCTGACCPNGAAQRCARVSMLAAREHALLTLATRHVCLSGRPFVMRVALLLLLAIGLCDSVANAGASITAVDDANFDSTVVQVRCTLSSACQHTRV